MGGRPGAGPRRSWRHAHGAGRVGGAGGGTPARPRRCRPPGRRGPRDVVVTPLVSAAPERTYQRIRVTAPRGAPSGTAGAGIAAPGACRPPPPRPARPPAAGGSSCRPRRARRPARRPPPPRHRRASGPTCLPGCGAAPGPGCACTGRCSARCVPGVAAGPASPASSAVPGSTWPSPWSPCSSSPCSSAPRQHLNRRAPSCRGCGSAAGPGFFVHPPGRL